MTTTTILAGCLSGFLVGCIASRAERRWRAGLELADHLADQEQYEAAMAAYQSLLDGAPDMVDERYITYRLGWIEERRENYSAAIAYYTRLLEQWPTFADEDGYTPQGLFRLGLILYDHLGQTDQALQVWRQVVATYPGIDGPAHRSLDAILVHFEQNELTEEAVRYLAEEYRVLKNTPMADNLLYWLAYWWRHHLGDSQQAYELFRQVREGYYDTSGLRDDAEWEMVEILHEWGDFKRELILLRDIAAEREFNIIFGSDATTSMENAAYRIGVVVQEDLRDPEGAIREFQRFLDGWRFSLYRDDAAYRIIQATLELDDLPAADRRGRQFLLDFPESRYTDEVHQLLAGLSEVDP